MLISQLPLGKVCMVAGSWVGYGHEYCMPIETSDLEEFSCVGVSKDSTGAFTVDLSDNFAWVDIKDLAVLPVQPTEVLIVLDDEMEE